ncbi:DUF1707 SHOCT-like domain-containing protein [Corynebacterium hadale]|uniref:DUF1707 SHOCT-like domain-containing protein n=1 Tax=Corynebacterium hadale TaxID=2026255 RepID=UPI000BAA6D7D|nr:DUF1707 domain-containing protein [Corynebacterium hadale]PAT07455.1 hypothetical protein CKJ82_09695 [Corynebacterium hadale]PAT12508.1 hypothetical protein CKJ83_07105 [Corynebacterium hadale]
MSIRCNHDDRNRAAEVLSTALGQGQIDVNEFEERSSKCEAATTRDDLVALIADLVDDPQNRLFGHREPAQIPGAELAPPVEAALAQVQAVERGRSVSLGVFGGSKVRGDAIAATHTAVGVFGGVDIDLRGAQLAKPVTTINAVGVFGGVDVYVPEGFRVRVNGVGLFGGHDMQLAPGVIDPADLPDSAPEIVVRCFSLFGGVDVHVVRRGDPRL